MCVWAKHASRQPHARHRSGRTSARAPRPTKASAGGIRSAHTVKTAYIQRYTAGPPSTARCASLPARCNTPRVVHPQCSQIGWLNRTRTGRTERERQRARRHTHRPGPAAAPPPRPCAPWRRPVQLANCAGHAPARTIGRPCHTMAQHRRLPVYVRGGAVTGRERRIYAPWVRVRVRACLEAGRRARPWTPVYLHMSGFQ